MLSYTPSVVRAYNRGPTISRNGTEQIGTLFHGTERNGTDRNVI